MAGAVGSRSVVYNSQAREDIDREWNFLLANGGVRVADRFLIALEKTSSTLASFPNSGIPCGFAALRAHGIRRFPLRLAYRRWLIFYEPTPRGILVHRLINGSRDLSGSLPS